MTREKEVFPRSRELIEFIEGHGWTLYDVTRPPKVAFTWEELKHQKPVEEFAIGHDHLFVPIPEVGQTPRDAYSVTKGLGPSLLVEDMSDERWKGLSIDKASYESGRPIMFTRLWFPEGYEVAVATSPKTWYLPDPDLIGIKYTYVLDTFRKYFRIVTPEEFGLPRPVPMPLHPHRN